jgi:hypothetical protein
MAGFEFEWPRDWEDKLNRLDKLSDTVEKDMLNAGAKVVARALSTTKFGKYVVIKKARKNKYGWFAQVRFMGNVTPYAPKKASTPAKEGARAATAAFIYEYGRGGANPQPARPEIRSMVKSAEPETIAVMEKVLEEALKK